MVQALSNWGKGLASIELETSSRRLNVSTTRPLPLPPTQLFCRVTPATALNFLALTLQA